MEKYYLHFNRDIPELVDELKKFIARVNEYLLGLADDEKYHPSKTRGKSPSSDLTFIDGPWRFDGKQNREKVPLVGEAKIKFHGRTVCEMKSHSRVVSSKDVESIQHCLKGAAKNYNSDLPWCGPEEYIDKETSLVYRAYHFDKNEKFYVSEMIYNLKGALLWQATCDVVYV